MSFYSSREDKPTWLLKEFSHLFKDARRVLDVGCDRKQLMASLPSNIAYTGLDIREEADVQWDLDSGGKLPFQDKEYDLVICLEALEHIEHIHSVFDELCRISSKYILISLPNPLSRIFLSYLLGRGIANKDEQQKHFGKYMKFYGLPFEPPIDRHRWFFNTEESQMFVEYRAQKNGWRLKSVKYSLDVKARYKKYLWLALAGFQKKRMYNFFSGTTVFLLEKMKQR